MKIEQEIVQSSFKNTRHKAIVNIFYTYNWLLEKHVELLKPFGISFQQFNILRILRGQYPKPAAIKLIKARMLDKMSDVSRLVEKLRVKGLLERKECMHDRRHVDVIITQKGLDLLTNLDDKIDGVHSLLCTLSDAEVDQLNEFLDRMRS